MGLSIEYIDDVLEFLGANPDFHTLKGIRSKFEDDFEGQVMYDRDFYILLDKLKKDGFIIQGTKNLEFGKFKSEVKVYCISYEGILFLEQGGYKELSRREAQDRAFEERKKGLENEQIQSTVNTNNSVILTNTIQRKLTGISIIVAGASAIFSLGAIFATLKDTTDEEVRLLRLQLQKQSQIQEQMQQSQRGIDSSLKGFFLERSQSKDSNSKR